MCSISVVTDLSEHEQSREQGCLQVVCDSPENLQKVHRTEYFLTQGCQCMTECTLPDNLSVQKRARSVVRIAIALIVRTQKYSAKQSKREQETDQEVV